MKTTDIEYRDGALTCRGFLAYDETKTGRRPGVLVVHEAFGLGKHAMDRAKMLVELGYVAFAADMFGDRMQVTELPKAIEIITDLLGNPPKLLARADAATLMHGDRAEVLGGLPRLEQEAAGPHRDVHEVRVVADRVPVLPAGARERHGPDPRPGRRLISPSSRHEYIARDYDARFCSIRQVDNQSLVT